VFGTIAHAQLKSGDATQLNALMAEWTQTIRPTVSGPFHMMVGHVGGDPSQVVFVALAQDEATYRALAASPAQDAFYQRFNQVFEAEPTWEDVEMDITIQE